MAKPRHRERKYSAVISAVTFQNRRLDGQGVISYPDLQHLLKNSYVILDG
jgi:hypothetical protein